MLGTRTGRWEMKKLLSMLIALTIVFGALVFVRATNNEVSDWVCFQKDAQRRGQAYFSERLTTPLAQAWEVPLKEALKGTIIIGKDIIVATTEKGKIAAFALSDGKEIWKRDFGVATSCDMALQDEIIFVGLKNGKCLGLDLYTGGTLWEYLARSEVRSAPLPYIGYFYFVTMDGMLVALTAGSGLPNWSFDTRVRVEAPISLLQLGWGTGTYMSIMIPAMDGKLYAISSLTKDIEWQLDLSGPMTSPAVPAGEAIITVAPNGTVQALSLGERKPYWTVDLARSTSVSPCLFQTSSFVGLATNDGKVAGVRIGDGFKIWEVQTAGTISQPLVGIDQNVIAVTDNGHVQVLHSFDGSLVSDLDLKDPITTPPSYSAGGIFLGTKSGKLVCLRPRAGFMKIALDPIVTIISPSEIKKVIVKFQSYEGDKSKYYLSNTGFPCRCKLDRKFLPEVNIMPGEERTLEIKADPAAESSTYEYSVSAILPTDPTMKVVASGVVIVAKADEVVKTTIVADNATTNKVFVRIGYEGAKFMKTFAGTLVYDPKVLRPVTNKLLSESPDMMPLTDITYPGEDRLFIGWSSTRPTDPKLDVFQVEFDVLASGKTTLNFMPLCRTKSGYIQPTSPASAEIEVSLKQVEHTVVLQLGNLTAKIDGKDEKLTVAPYIKSGRTMVPLRFIGTALGAGVEWNATERSVLYTNTLATGARSIKLWIGKKSALVDGKETPVDPPPEIKSGSTCVGLSFVSQNFGADVLWDATTRTVTMKFKK